MINLNKLKNNRYIIVTDKNDKDRKFFHFIDFLNLEIYANSEAFSGDWFSCKSNDVGCWRSASMRDLMVWFNDTRVPVRFKVEIVTERHHKIRSLYKLLMLNELRS